jgi:uncharacterized membrane protein YkoI
MHRNNNKLSVLALLAIALATTGTLAHAHPKELDAAALANSKISLVQAVTTAEQHVNGHASKAEFERSWRGAIYEVDVVSGDKVFEVKVDADQGTVLSSAEEKSHDDEHHEHEHDGHAD